MTVTGVEIRRTMANLADAIATIADEREQLQAENKKLRSRCAPTHNVVIGDTGHYVAYEVFKHIEELNAKLDTANALVTCCCGSPVDAHGMGDGHSPVDMYHYAHMKLTEQNDKLTAMVRLLLENDPTELVSDGGHTVLDLWRHDARQALGIRV